MADLEKMILAKRENGFGGFVNYIQDKYGDAQEYDDENYLFIIKKPSMKRNFDLLELLNALASFSVTNLSESSLNDCHF
jgi:hypothetical protein